jgi:hypothetical protein
MLHQPCNNKVNFGYLLAASLVSLTDVHGVSGSGCGRGKPVSKVACLAAGTNVATPQRVCGIVRVGCRVTPGRL